MPRFVRGALVLLAAALVSGCGTRPVPVRGVVKLDGQPVASAGVAFVAESPGGRDAYGATDEKGEFRLTTINPNDGAFPGRYKVTITPTGEAGGSSPYDDLDKPRPSPARAKASSRPRIPVKYSVPGQTPLTQEVPAAGDLVIDLSSK